MKAKWMQLRLVFKVDDTEHSIPISAIDHWELIGDELTVTYADIQGEDPHEVIFEGEEARGVFRELTAVLT